MGFDVSALPVPLAVLQKVLRFGGFFDNRVNASSACQPAEPEHQPLSVEQQMRVGLAGEILNCVAE
jgi:hypothetical protein